MRSVTSKDGSPSPQFKTSRSVIWFKFNSHQLLGTNLIASQYFICLHVTALSSESSVLSTCCTHLISK
jgi:hypothetical protein